MPSKKNKVSFFLEDGEVEALNRYKKQNDCSNGEALITLLNKEAVYSEYDPNQIVEKGKHDERLAVIERQISLIAEGIKHLSGVAEKHAKVAEIFQDEIDGIREQVQSSSQSIEPEYLTDEQVASHVGVRVEKVTGWRLGVRKPQGKNVKKRLSDIELYFGRWRIRNTGKTTKNPLCVKASL